ncbi:MAG: sulfatase [Spirochaetota bacterium]
MYTIKLHMWGICLLFAVMMLTGCMGGSGSEYSERLIVDLSDVPGRVQYTDTDLQQKIGLLTRDSKIFRDPRAADNTPLLRVTFEIDPERMWHHMKKAYYLGSSDNKPCTLSLPLPGADEVTTLTFSLAGLRKGGSTMKGSLALYLVGGEKKIQLKKTGEEDGDIPVKDWKDYSVQVPAHGSNERLEVTYASSSSRVEHCFLGLPRLFDRRAKDDSGSSVVFICVDAMRADAVESVVPGYDITPRMDQVAGDGVVFTNHFTVSNWTRPATMAMLASTYGSSTGINFYNFSLGEKEKEYFYRESDTLPVNMALQKEGYISASIGNNAFILDYSGIGVDLGFDELSEYQTECRDTIDITREVVTWLKKNRHRDFFLFVNYNAPHSAYIPPPEFLERTRNKGLQKHRWFRRYLGEVAYTDHQVGIIMDALKEMGLYDDTIVVITSDHGEVFHPHHSISPYTDTLAVFSHGQTQYDEELHTPLIIKPAAKSKLKGKKIKQQVRNIDIVPTLLDIMGFQVPDVYAGKSLVSMIQGKERKDLPVYSEGRRMYSVRIDGWKYAERFYGFGTRPWHWGGQAVHEYSELYNCNEDPDELDNLASRMPEKVKEMRKHLHSMRFKQPDNVIMAHGSDIRGTIFTPTGFIYNAEVSGDGSSLVRVNRKTWRFSLQAGDRITYQTIPADAKTVLGSGDRVRILGGEYLLPVGKNSSRSTHLDPALHTTHGAPPGEMVALAEPGMIFWHMPVQGGIRQVSSDTELSGEMHSLLKQWGYIQDGEE